MLRAVIYARYSSDNQREASIEDQIEVCRRYVERQGWTIGKVYADQALSGASRFRPAFQQMQADAEQRRFDVIVVEALDRLSTRSGHHVHRPAEQERESVLPVGPHEMVLP
jgi:DNA invertase Pin-like site-specific DNA recombinase